MHFDASNIPNNLKNQANHHPSHETPCLFLDPKGYLEDKTDTKNRRVNSIAG